MNIVRRRQRCRRLWGMMLLMLASALAVTGWAAESQSPEDTLRAYLAAMKALDFDTVYDLSTKAASRGKDRATWAGEMKYLFKFSDAKIFAFQVFPGKVTGGKALVPNILTSQDKFLNQLGVPEHELYTLLREDGRWKVDRQIIVDPQDIAKWFPGEGDAPDRHSVP